MAHTIVHFEIPANDPEKLASFYTQLFGWKIEKRPGPMEYWRITMGESEAGVNGGLMRRQDPRQIPTNYISVESVEAFSQKVVSLGGKVIVPKMAVPQMGYFTTCLDPDGNCFALWEDNPQAG